MKQVVYAMQFKGGAKPGANPQQLKVRGEAASNSITSVTNHGGLTGGFDPAAITSAVFESEVTIVGEGRFIETGQITFGPSENGHQLHFSTIGQGWMGPSPEPNLQQGTITWTVDGGTGQFQGSAGVITSNFTLDQTGQVVDYHLGIIYLK